MVYIGSGIASLINAPTAISAAKSAHVVRDVYKRQVYIYIVDTVEVAS